MDVRSYATSSGPHPAGTYALMAVDQIIQVEPTAAPELMAAGLMLKARLLTAFTPIFQDCVDAERAAIAETSARLNAAMNPMPFMDRAYVKLVEAVEAGPFRDHFARTLTRSDGSEVSVLAVHAQTLANHFGTCIHIERAWWADHHPDDSQSAIFKARVHG